MGGKREKIRRIRGAVQLGYLPCHETVIIWHSRGTSGSVTEKGQMTRGVVCSIKTLDSSRGKGTARVTT